MGLPQFEYEHCEQSQQSALQSTSVRQSQSRKRRYLLMAGIFGVVFVASTIIIVVVALNYQEEQDECMDGLKCIPAKDCEGELISDIAFPCGQSKICCKPKLSTRTEVHEKTLAERLRKRKIMKEDYYCGITGYELQDKVANGENVTLGSLPWMAILGYTALVHPNQPDLKFKCGGTLITDQYILTAAHCINPELTTVYLGTVNLTSIRYNTTECKIEEDGSKQCVYPSKFSVVNVITHPEYNNITFKNDIALLKLNRKVDFKNELFIAKICLPFDFKLDEKLTWKNFTLSLSGWGLVEFGGSIYSILQEGKKILPWKYDRCTDNLAQVSRVQLPLTRKQICATGENSTEACFGDSGGPLSHTQDVTTQIGIISFKPVGKTCGTEKQPTVFTRVDGYLDWILDNIDI